MLSIESLIHYGDNIEVTDDTKAVTIYEMRNETGEGIMSMMHVFPGVEVMYNDFHMSKCTSKFKSKCKMFSINHCREGRIEWEVNNSYLYLQEEDLQIDGRERHDCDFGFPSSHYHGITIVICIDDIPEKFKELLNEFGIDIYQLYEKYCNRQFPFIRRSDQTINNIFEELYNLNTSKNVEYLKIKILELLVFLQMMNHEVYEARTYFPKRQVQKIKEIATLITSDLQRNYTIDELSELFDISITSLKLCFKGVYGLPIGQYVREYRMMQATHMLRESELNVVQIAGSLGYDNQSKFAAAFKSLKGTTPTEYRKKCLNGVILV